MQGSFSKVIAALRPKRRWLRLSLRSLFVLTAVFALWLGDRVHRARQQQQAAAMVQRHGGEVSYDYLDEARRQPGVQQRMMAAMTRNGPPVVFEPPGPRWLRELIGDEYFITLNRVDLVDCAATDADMELLQSQSDLWCLRLRETKITDEGLQHITGLRDLAVLDLRNAQVTDAGLETIGRLKSIKGLGLGSTQITDDGLASLQGLSKVYSLGLSHTGITDKGLVHLKGMTDMGRLSLDGTKITDAGLVHLRGMRSLNRLELNETQITDAGLIHLEGFRNLSYLNVNDTGVSEAGVQHLFELLPKLTTVLRNPSRLDGHADGVTGEGESQFEFTD